MYIQMQKIIMKKLLFTFGLLSTFILAQASRTFDIQIQVQGVQNEEAILAYNMGEKKYIADTLQFDQLGLTHIHGEKDYNDGTYLLVFPSHEMTSFEFIIRETHFKLKTDIQDLAENMTVIGSMENEAMYSDLQSSIQVGKKIEQLQEVLKSESSSEKEKERAKSKIDEIGKNFTDERLQNIQSKPHLLYHKILFAVRDVPMNIQADEDDEDARAKAYNHFINHYWDNIDFSDVALVRSPVVLPRIISFFDKIHPNPDSLSHAASIIIEKASVNLESYEIVLAEITNHFARSKVMGHASVYVYLLDNYYLQGKAHWVDQETIEKMRKRADAMRPTLIGKVAPDMTIYDLNHRPLNLHSSIEKNDYTVLVFWNSECNHCQKEMPELVQIYQDELEQENVGVFAISTEVEREHVIDFIKEHQMGQVFTNGYDPTGRSGFRVLYDITSTPVVVLLDQDKKILAKKLAVKDIPYVIQTHREHHSKK